MPIAGLGNPRQSAGQSRAGEGSAALAENDAVSLNEEDAAVLWLRRAAAAGDGDAMLDLATQLSEPAPPSPAEPAPATRLSGELSGVNQV